MQIESGYLSTEFTRSLLLSQPNVTVTAWVTQVYQWLVVFSGLVRHGLTCLSLHTTTRAIAGDLLILSFNSYTGSSGVLTYGLL